LIPIEEVKRKSKRICYIEQLIFINKKLKWLIDKLLSKSKIPPIIILQADEGPFPLKYDFEIEENNFDWRKATDEELKEKMRILNAYYLPNVNKDILYPTITPVNTFRLIFNLYFKEKLELLPDESYAFVDGKHIYQFFNVTKRLKSDEK